MDQLPLFNGEATLNLTKPIAFFDLETTGVDTVKDRIIEIGIIRINPNQEQIRKNYVVNPTIPIPLEASKIHGIYDEDVATAPKFADIAAELFELLDPCDLAGFNSNRFDVPMLLEEFIRAGFSFSIDNRSLVDVHRIYTLMEKRDLATAYQFYCGKSIENAHSAEADTEATMEVLFSQLKKYPDLKGDVRFLHDFSNEERFIDSGRRLIYLDGKPSFHFGKYKGQTIAEVLKKDPSYYSWMMNGDFALHTKQKLKELKEGMKL